MAEAAVKTCFPESLAEALDIRSRENALPLAGGTDLMVRYRAKNGLEPSFPGPVMFVHAVPELRELELREDELLLGASLPMALLADDPGERKAWVLNSGRQGQAQNQAPGQNPAQERMQKPAGEQAPAPGQAQNQAPGLSEALAAIPKVLRDAAASLGAPALRQRAVLAGNVANASPAGDTLAALYALDAAVILESVAGSRRLPIDQFVTGPGKTVLKPDELIRAFCLPAAGSGWYYWRKVGTRRANALTKVSLAACAKMNSGKVAELTLAFGAVGPTVVCVRTAVGTEPDIPAIVERVRQNVHPIDDQRSTAEYRKQVALNLTVQALESLKEYMQNIKETAHD